MGEYTCRGTSLFFGRQRHRFTEQFFFQTQIGFDCKVSIFTLSFCLYILNCDLSSFSLICCGYAKAPEGTVSALLHSSMFSWLSVPGAEDSSLWLSDKNMKVKGKLVM